MGWIKAFSLFITCFFIGSQQATAFEQTSYKTQDVSSYYLIENTQRTKEIILKPEATFSPYISAEEELPSSQWDTYWRNHSYESAFQPERGNAWAGVKVKLSNMLKLDVDTNTRHIRSSINLSPKTKVKIRAKFNGIRADIIYRY